MTDHRHVLRPGRERELDVGARHGLRHRDGAELRLCVATHSVSRVLVPLRWWSLTAADDCCSGREHDMCAAAQATLWMRRDGPGASATCCSTVACAHRYENSVWSRSLPALAARTDETVLPAAGLCSRRVTSASALQAPVQRVHVSSSPIA